MKWVVCFDISDDKKRKKIGNMLEEFGVRVQRSVFEVEISKKNLQKLINEFDKMVDKKEDSIRFYPFYKDTVQKIICLGYGLEAFDGRDVYFF